MSISEKKIARKTINWCKSVKKNICKFSYEYDDEDNYDDDRYDDEYPFEDDFKEILLQIFMMRPICL